MDAKMAAGANIKITFEAVGFACDTTFLGKLVMSNQVLGVFLQFEQSIFGGIFAI